jgi:hypothetical protein
VNESEPHTTQKQTLGKCFSLKFLGSFPLQPIPKNEGYDNHDEKKGSVAAMKGLLGEVKREDA